MYRERPILFSSPMVNAILAGRKTQTRRVVKLNMAGRVQLSKRQWHIDDPNAVLGCPYGQPGDRLWVKETHAFVFHPDGDLDGEQYSVECETGETGRFSVRYAADGSAVEWDGGWRPSIFMPRWASRITLEITGVRVERLNEISEEDARAEGAERVVMPERGIIHNPLDHEDELIASHKNGFQFIWECISGLDSWDANPWVWVISFKRI